MRLRGDQIGSLIAAVFGLIYVLVNTSSLPAAVAWLLRAVALAAFLAIVTALYRRRNQPAGDDDQGGGFGLAYWVVVLVEAVALFGGLRVLAGPLDSPQAGVAWVSLVVGVHFFALARVFEARFFDVLGAAITACGVVGLGLALVDAPQSAVDVVSGVVPGLVLLGFGWWGTHRKARSISATPSSTGSPGAAGG